MPVGRGAGGSHCLSSAESWRLQLIIGSVACRLSLLVGLGAVHLVVFGVFRLIGLLCVSCGRKLFPLPLQFRVKFLSLKDEQQLLHELEVHLSITGPCTCLSGEGLGGCFQVVNGKHRHRACIVCQRGGGRGLTVRLPSGGLPLPLVMPLPLGLSLFDRTGARSGLFFFGAILTSNGGLLMLWVRADGCMLDQLYELPEQASFPQLPSAAHLCLSASTLSIACNKHTGAPSGGSALMPRRCETLDEPPGKYTCGYPYCAYNSNNDRDVSRHRTLSGHGYAATAAAMAAIAAQNAPECGRTQPTHESGSMAAPDHPDQGYQELGSSPLEGSYEYSCESEDVLEHAAGEQYGEAVPEVVQDHMDMGDPEDQQPEVGQRGCVCCYSSGIPDESSAYCVSWHDWNCSGCMFMQRQPMYIRKHTRVPYGAAPSHPHPALLALHTHFI